MVSAPSPDPERVLRLIRALTRNIRQKSKGNLANFEEVYCVEAMQRFDDEVA